jgi:hypothetical protein
MAKYLIEVPHSEDQAACLRAIEVFISSGNHFLANAEWGCKDKQHKAWMIVDLENKDQALQVVPSMYRSSAIITELFRVTHEDINQYKEKKRLKNTEDYHNRNS